MKKRTIWILGTLMSFCFLGLLFLQINYMEEVAKMRNEQFDESVKRALYQASRNLERDETLEYWSATRRWNTWKKTSTCPTK